MTDAEIPTHLAGPPDVPDKRVFELKAKMNALTKRLLAAEKQRDDAVEAKTTTNAAMKSAAREAEEALVATRHRAEQAEILARENATRAIDAETRAADAERRAAHAEATAREQSSLVAALREEIETLKAVGVTLEDDVDVLRAKVTELEVGVGTFSRSSQTTEEEDDARGGGGRAAGGGREGLKDRAASWMARLDRVGSDPLAGKENEVVWSAPDFSGGGAATSTTRENEPRRTATSARDSNARRSPARLSRGSLAIRGSVASRGGNGSATNRDTISSYGDDAYLYDDYDTQSEFSDRDVVGGGDDQWAGDDPNWTAA
jgi:uncharacterized coiled-coil protein SlyX